MATETLYATSLVSGAVSTPGNALGAPDGVFTTDVDNVSWTARFAMGNPVGNTANGNHTITVRVRKETGNGTPTINAIRIYTSAGLLWENATGWSVTSTTGQTITAYSASGLSGTDLSSVEVEIVTTGVGGSGSNRTCVQLDAITWSGDFTTEVLVKNVNVGQASTADSPQSMTVARARSVAVGQAAVVGSALSMTAQLRRYVPVGLAAGAAEEALIVTPSQSGGPQNVNVLQALESDSVPAGQHTRRKSRTLGLAR